MVIRYRFRLYILALLIVFGIAALIVRLYEIQVEEHPYWVSQLPGEKEVTVRVPGVRGEIKDRHGLVLATNRASYEVTFNLKEIVDKYKESEEELPVTTYDARDSGMERKREEYDVVQIVEDSVLPGLLELDLFENYNAEQLQMHYRSTRGVVPYTYRRELSFEDFARFAENNFELPGVDVTIKPTRKYPYDALASHLLGYVKLPDIQRVPEEERRTYDFYVPDDFGVHGIEKSMDHYLQGKAGKRTLRQDEKGVIRGEIDFKEPEAGADVFLTIDSKIQTIAEQALRAIGRGAAVVMDPRSGEILAMASVPSFNPNNFMPTVSPEDWERYLGDETKPLFNRALSAHPPGSTYKIPISLAGCLSDSHENHFYCAGGVQYGSKFMRCWILSKGGRHGSIGLSDAIMRSCNCYFYQFGNHTGIENIMDVSAKLGLGRKTGIPLEGESPGLAPSPQWLRLQGQKWSDAYTAMTAIGQGFVQATPLQMCWVTSTLANGGKVYQPRLVKKVVASDGTVLVPDEPVLKHDLTQQGLTEEEVQLVREGMWKVVNAPGGTARRARSETVEVCGKTGTAQTGRSDEPTDAWFISFAPYEEPELAVCVYVANGKAGGLCGAPIAGHIVKQVMAMKHGYEVAVEPLEEAPGHFDRIEMVSYDDAGLDEFVEGDEADGVVEMPSGFTPQVTRSNPAPVVAQPTISRQADRRGTVPDRQRQNYRDDENDRWKDLRDDDSDKKRGGLFKNLFKKKRNR